MTINTDENVRKILTISRLVWAQIEDFRFERRFRSESEALKSLVEKGLEAAKAEGQVGGGDRSAN